jgi:hypothetical protein
MERVGRLTIEDKYALSHLIEAKAITYKKLFNILIRKVWRVLFLM